MCSGIENDWSSSCSGGSSKNPRPPAAMKCRCTTTDSPEFRHRHSSVPKTPELFRMAVPCVGDARGSFPRPARPRVWSTVWPASGRLCRSTALAPSRGNPFPSLSWCDSLNPPRNCWKDNNRSLKTNLMTPFQFKTRTNSNEFIVGSQPSKYFYGATSSILKWFSFRVVSQVARTQGKVRVYLIAIMHGRVKSPITRTSFQSRRNVFPQPRSASASTSASIRRPLRKSLRSAKPTFPRFAPATSPGCWLS